MKLNVYNIETIKPSTDNEYWKWLEIMNLPSLKYGTVECMGTYSHSINKTELKKLQKVSARYYNRTLKIFMTGLLLVGFKEKFFIPIEQNKFGSLT
jgi:hypothetical protein